MTALTVMLALVARAETLTLSNGQHIIFADIGRHVESKLTVSSCHFILASHQVAVQPNVGTIADAVEGKQHMVV